MFCYLLVEWWISSKVSRANSSGVRRLSLSHYPPPHERIDDLLTPYLAMTRNIASHCKDRGIFVKGCRNLSFSTICEYSRLRRRWSSKVKSTFPRSRTLKAVMDELSISPIRKPVFEGPAWSYYEKRHWAFKKTVVEPQENTGSSSPGVECFAKPKHPVTFRFLDPLIRILRREMSPTLLTLFLCVADF